MGIQSVPGFSFRLNGCLSKKIAAKCRWYAIPTIETGTDYSCPYTPWRRVQATGVGPNCMVRLRVNKARNVKCWEGSRSLPCEQSIMYQHEPWQQLTNSATSNDMKLKLVHWPLISGLLHLVQRGGDWAGPQPAQAPPRCTKCNSPPINGQCTNHRTVQWSVALRF